MLTTFDKHGPFFQQPTSKEDTSEMNMTLGESSEKDAWLLIVKVGRCGWHGMFRTVTVVSFFLHV